MPAIDTANSEMPMIGRNTSQAIAMMMNDHATPNTSLMMPWIFVLCSIPFALLGWFIVRKGG